MNFIAELFMQLFAFVLLAILIATVVNVLKEANITDIKKIKTKEISIGNIVKNDYFHKGCETEGHAIHPEKTGILKNKKNNPFEL